MHIYVNICWSPPSSAVNFTHRVSPLTNQGHFHGFGGCHRVYNARNEVLRRQVVATRQAISIASRFRCGRAGLTPESGYKGVGQSREEVVQGGFGVTVSHTGHGLMRLFLLRIDAA